MVNQFVATNWFVSQFQGLKKFPKIERPKILLINDERVLETYILYISTYGRRPVHLFVYSIRYVSWGTFFPTVAATACESRGFFLWYTLHSYRLRCLNGILSTGLFLFIFLSLIKAVTIATISYGCSFCFCFDGVPRHHDAC